LGLVMYAIEGGGREGIRYWEPPVAPPITVIWGRGGFLVRIKRAFREVL
jgi:hypothetical protein